MHITPDRGFTAQQKRKDRVGGESQIEIRMAVKATRGLLIAGDDQYHAWPKRGQIAIALLESGYGSVV
jgi:hypothetical protein